MNDDFAQIQSPHFITRLEACERILAKRGIHKGLFEVCHDAWLAIRARDPAVATKQESINFAKARNLLQEYVEKHGHDIDYSAMSPTQLNDLLVQTCRSFKGPANRQMILLLLEHGASIDSKDRFGQSVFFNAMRVFRMETLKVFLSYGADINEVYHTHDGSFFTSVWLRCVAYAEPEHVELMLAQGADIAACNSDGQTALHLQCAANAIPQALRLLIEAGSEINRQDKQGQTALSLACKGAFHWVDAVQFLLDAGADPNIADHEKTTPLHRAAFVLSEDATVVRNLLQRNASINAVDRQGNTPLHIAVGRENKAVVAELVKHGSDVSLLNRKHKNPCQLALDKGLVDIATLLDSDAPEKYQKRSNNNAIQELKKQIIDRLQKGYTFVREDKEGITHFVFRQEVFVAERYEMGQSPPMTRTYRSNKQALDWLLRYYKDDRLYHDSELAMLKAILRDLRKR